MTPQEFKSWFEGFTEAMSGVPTKVQWARVKERVAEIDGKSVTQQIFVDRYWQYYQHPWGYYSRTYASGIGGIGANSACGSSQGPYQNSGTSQSFNANNAMLALGHADAQLLEVS